MLLCCDIGNTFVKFALYSEGELVKFEKTPHSEAGVFLNNTGFTEAAITSVVPQLTGKLLQVMQNKGIDPFILSRNSRLNIAVNYETPETLGLDRICSMEGAFGLYKGKTDFNEADLIISVDMGTATTVNVLEYPGIFTGGIISAGVETILAALNKFTAALPLVEPGEYAGLPGKSTRKAIAAGAVHSTAGLINEILEHYPGKNIALYITGGSAEHVLPHIKHEYVYVKDLVLRGLKSVYELNRKL